MGRTSWAVFLCYGRFRRAIAILHAVPSDQWTLTDRPCHVFEVNVLDVMHGPADQAIGLYVGERQPTDRAFRQTLDVNGPTFQVVNGDVPKTNITKIRRRPCGRRGLPWVFRATIIEE